MIENSGLLAPFGLYGRSAVRVVGAAEAAARPGRSGGAGGVGRGNAKWPAPMRAVATWRSLLRAMTGRVAARAAVAPPGGRVRLCQEAGSRQIGSARASRLPSDAVRRWSGIRRRAVRPRGSPIPRETCS